jgi:predicted nucleotidyltransferase
VLELIAERLANQARESNIRILYACESGSRAWGFASPDSDFDVRFIYSHDADWYLRLRDRDDHIESMDDVTTIDLAGWELRKALRLFASCNPVMYEWLQSPVVYSQEDEFVNRLRARIPDFFIPRRAIFHYLGTARQIAKNYLDGDRIQIKKAFYILRPLAAASWIRDLGTMPPTDFHELIANTTSPEVIALLPHIAELLQRKAAAIEKHPITLPSEIAAYFDESFATLEAAAESMPRNSPADVASLDSFFREFLRVN